MIPTASSTWSFGTATRATSTATSCSTGSGPIGPWSRSSTASTSAARRRVEPSSGTSAFGLCRNERPRFDERAPTRAEDRMARDRGLVSEKEQLKALIRDAAKDEPTMSEFVRRLQAEGVQVRANIARTGHVSGISYRLDRVAVKGSGLGRVYSFEGLQKEQGVRYDRSARPAGPRASRAGDEGTRAGRRRRRPFRLPSPSRALSRLPGYQEARTALWLAHNLELAGRAPGRAALNVAERLLPPDARDSGSGHSQRHRSFARQVIHERGPEGRSYRPGSGPASRGGAAISGSGQGDDRRRRSPILPSRRQRRAWIRRRESWSV